MTAHADPDPPVELEPRAAPTHEARAGASRHVGFHVAGVMVIAAAVLGVFALSSTRHRAEARETEARKEELSAGPRVEVATIAETPPGRVVTLSGEVRPYRQATLYAKVSGYLKYVQVDKGDKVRASEVLGIIESPETENDLASKQADVAIKKLTDERYRQLAKEGLVSQQETDKAHADLDIAHAELSRINSLRGYQVIRAPFAGVVTARYADQGALLQAATGATQSALPLVDVADVDRVRVFLYLGQQDALFVREGDPAVLWTDQFPDRKVTAKVTRFTKQLDARTRTMLTEIEVDNRTAGFYPGTFVRVSLTLATPASMSVPGEALVFRAGKPNVARVKDGHAVFAPIVLGEPDGAQVRVVSGVVPGDVVVLHPGDDVVDGVAVRVSKRGSKT